MSIERDALVLDGAIDAMLAGLEMPDVELVSQAAQLFAAMEAVPPAAGREAARTRTLSAVAPVRSRRWIRWVAAIPGVAVLASAGIAFASRNALPGDALYGIKRLQQSSRIAISIGDVARAKALLGRAEADLAAARTRVSQGRRHDARETLEAFWPDLDAARRVISTLGPQARDPLQAQAGALAADAAELEASLENENVGRHGSGGDASVLDEESEDRDEIDDHGGTGEARSGSDDGSVESRSGSSGSTDEPEESPTPNDDDHSGSGSNSGEESPTPSPAESTHD